VGYHWKEKEDTVDIEKVNNHVIPAITTTNTKQSSAA